MSQKEDEGQKNNNDCSWVLSSASVASGCRPSARRWPERLLTMNCTCCGCTWCAAGEQRRRANRSRQDRKERDFPLVKRSGAGLFRQFPVSFIELLVHFLMFADGTNDLRLTAGKAFSRRGHGPNGRRGG